MEQEIDKINKELDETKRELFELEQIALYVNDDLYDNWDEIVEEMKLKGIWVNYDD